jgi:uncharacterized caspase-like protein
VTPNATGWSWETVALGPNVPDVGIIFFSGDGAKGADGNFYLIPADADRRDLPGTAVSEERVKGLLAEIPGHLVLLLDACHAGALGGDRR